jgi:hypothetical protein
MKRITYIIFALTMVLASCKKDPKQPETLDAPATIIFNDNIDLVSNSFPTGTPKGNGEVALKISTSDNVKQLKFVTRLSGVDYAQGTVTVPAGGVYSFSKLVKDLRGPTDPVLPAGTSSSVAVTLIVEGILADGSSVKRVFTVTVTNP